MKKKIGIIGAGLSGLVTAKTLLEYGYDVHVFEKEAEIGGVWASCRHYPGLTTQNTRDSYAFIDFPMPRHYPEFPTGPQMQAYLLAYAQKFNLLPHIRLNCRIESARPVEWEREPGWQLTGQHDGRLLLEDLDFLVVCNGTFCEPFIPALDGLDRFVASGGQVLHTTRVKSPDAFRGRRVVVVGYGKSACDVAASLAATAAETTVVYRQARWKVPKRIMGVNYKYFILSRFGEALSKLHYRTGVENVIHALGLPHYVFNRMQRVFSRQQQLDRCGLRPEATIVDQLVGELSVETDGFFRLVCDGRIRALRGAIRALEPGQVRLADGACLEADTVVFGTGFSQTLPFLADDIRERLTDPAGNYRLYRHILPLQIPGLAFVGYNTSFFCNLTSELAALWLAEHLEGRIDLPGPAEQAAVVDEHLGWRLRQRTNSLFRGASVYPFNIAYVDWLLRDMNAGLSWPWRLFEWAYLIDPSHYRSTKRRVMRRGQSAHVAKRQGVTSNHPLTWQRRGG
jgi:dimethylaniline monooxygenase (N-oxide forming)